VTGIGIKGQAGEIAGGNAVKIQKEDVPDFAMSAAVLVLAVLWALWIIRYHYHFIALPFSEWL
jgi:hypothetical protein